MKFNYFIQNETFYLTSKIIGMLKGVLNPNFRPFSFELNKKKKNLVLKLILI